MIAVLFIALAVTLLMGIPVGFSIGISTTLAIAVSGSIAPSIIMQKLVDGINSFPLLALPLFVLSGSLMIYGSTPRIINLANLLLRKKRWGIGNVGIISCAAFGTISGSAVATTAAIGAIVEPEMVKKGYSKGYTASVIAGAGTLGAMIPPSTVFVVYAQIANVSISDMFMAGIIPGILTAALLCLYNRYTVVRNDWGKSTEDDSYYANMSRKEKLKIVWDAIPPLLMPVFVLGSVLSGIATPTEAATIATVYALFLALVVYRELSIKKMIQVFIDSAVNSATVLIIIAFAAAFAWVLTSQNVTLAIANAVVIAGGGFVGIEVAENLSASGVNVSVVEGADQIMAPFDYDMAQILHKELLDRGVGLYLSSMVTQITDTSVKAEKNGVEFKLPADVVVLSIGVAPETALAEKAGLRIGQCRGIAVDHNYQTSDPDIYAVGDAVETYDRMGRRFGSFAQAGPAQRQARAAADHICGQYHKYNGYIATSCLRLFGQNAACTGMNEKAAKRANIPYEVAYVLPADKVSIMPDSHYMAFKLLFEVPTGRILGAQAVGKGDVTRRIDTIAAMITMNATLDDLKELELCYSPVYGTAKDVVNMAALVGLNLLYGRIKQVRVDQARGLVESGAYIIDVREENEYALGHLKNAVNIPLSQFRERMEEVPRDRPVYLYCRTAQRSYFALCELIGNGCRNAYNISGSFLGVCLYEYFNDRSEGRAPIVTAYDFS